MKILVKNSTLVVAVAENIEFDDEGFAIVNNEPVGFTSDFCRIVDVNTDDLPDYINDSSVEVAYLEDTGFRKFHSGAPDPHPVDLE